MPRKCRDSGRDRGVCGVQAVGETVHLVGEQVPVEVERDLDAGVAEVRLDRLRMGALSDGQTLNSRSSGWKLGRR